MVKYFSAEMVKQAIQYFQFMDYKKPDRIGLYFICKAAGANQYKYVQFGKWGETSITDKRKYLRNLYDLGGCYDPLTETPRNSATIFPFSFRDSTPYNKATAAEKLGSRVPDSIDNSLINILVQRNPVNGREIILTKDYLDKLSKEYLKSTRINLVNFAIWVYRRYAFSMPDDTTASDMLDVAILALLEKYHISLCEFQTLFSFGNETRETIGITDTVMPIKDIRNTVFYGKDTTEIAFGRSNDFMSFDFCLPKDEARRYLEIRGKAALTSIRIEEILGTWDMERGYYDSTEDSTNEDDVEEVEGVKSCLDVQREARTNLIHPLNCIVYGAPGTGKTYSMVEYALAIINNKSVNLSSKSKEERKSSIVTYKRLISEGRIVFTTFHQNYGYEEFVQGLRPFTGKDGNVHFKYADGVLKQISERALHDSTCNYVLIIDEINRANISKVFGELITLIEDDKRWGELNETCVTLQSGDVFAVPNNLYIIGTMNSADKSISLIDAALRRRFEFIEQRPDERLITDPQLKRFFIAINRKLYAELDSSDLLIGHSYFMGKTASDLPRILNVSIIPLLYEYLYDNRKKVLNILNECIKNSNVEIIDDGSTGFGRIQVRSK